MERAGSTAKEAAGTGWRTVQVCIDLPALAQVRLDIVHIQPGQAEAAHMLPGPDPVGLELPADLGPPAGLERPADLGPVLVGPVLDGPVLVVHCGPVRDHDTCPSCRDCDDHDVRRDSYRGYVPAPEAARIQLAGLVVPGEGEQQEEQGLGGEGLEEACCCHPGAGRDSDLTTLLEVIEVLESV